ncbi:MULTISPECIES: SMP-30/gluconolactonase/LRE family protein [Sphingobium]|jgi:sugar lactone lactonase YvrE|uniref:Gluconolaconase n=1 Tax=Sphingobium yanoikuyae TaxID=13690 RepID=A0A0J9D5H1_SPHYA|nr:MULTISPECIES: SMP-30/gluconolactonase/LRE family protein [Sphingobium]ATP18829.1 gluconolaconase [Sphingobium yanoikuyae]KMW31771.1 gluconolaconase [Sphingobium yanoikuyae]TKV43151.1 gluconolaconase [Sphingobium sp. MP9-4]
MSDAAPRSVLSVGAILGEGPIWVEREAALWFVDIKGHAIHRFDPALDVSKSWTTPGQVGWIVPTDDGLFAVGLQSGVHRFDPKSGAFTLLHAPEAHRPGNRLNDATVAPGGALWFGSMDDAEEEESGRFYRLHRGDLVESGLAAVSITNGPALSPDGRILYHTDTLGRAIWQCPVDADGVAGAATLFTRIEDGAGYPDGPTVDAEGCLWTGLFGGWAVRRYDPAGRLMREIRFPVANITKIAFGGPELMTTYATTARKGLDVTALTEQPLAGDLFAFDAGVAGLPGHVATI